MRKALAVLALIVGWWQAALAEDVFTTRAVVAGNTVSLGFHSAEAAFDALNQRSLSDFVPYTGVETVNALVNYRGLAVAMQFPVFNGPQLQLTIPRLGIARTFVGATRDESIRLMKDYFKNSGDLDRIMRELAKVSPVDPIAGNPNSLQSRLVASTYDRTFRSTVSQISMLEERRRQAATDTSWWKIAAAGPDVPRPGAAPASTPSISAGVLAASYKQAGLRSTSISVPLSYAFPPDPARPFAVDGELQYVDVEGAKQYSVLLGASYRVRVSDRWFLIPSANYGISGSEDLGGAGQILSGAVTSAFRLYDSRAYTLWMGNGVSYLKTFDTTIGDYKVNSNLSNVVFVNGLVLSTPMAALGANSWLEFSFSDTRYTGTDVYNHRYDEIGVALARSGSYGSATYWKVGLNYLNGSHTHGGSLTLHYNF